MKTQTNFMIAFFALLLVVGFASATVLNIENTTTIPTNVDAGNAIAFSINLSHDGSSTFNYTLDWSDSSSEFSSLPSISEINVSETKTGSVTLNIPSSASGLNTYSLNVTGSPNSPKASLQFTVNVTPTTTSSGSDPLGLCSAYTFNSSGAIEISKVNDETLDNEDEWEWKPLDNIEIEVEVENNDNSDLEYDLRMYLFDGTDDQTSDVLTDDEDFEEDGVDVDEGKDEKVTFNAQIDGKADEGSYDLWIRVVDENDNCFVENAENVDVDKKSRQVVVKEVEGLRTVACGETADITARVSNIGSNDEDRVKVIAYNRELGLSIFKEVDDLDEGDTSNIFFSFVVPRDAEEGSYRIHVSTEYEYDEDDETYDEISDDKDDFSYTLNVLGNCVDLSKPTISADLESSAQVGEEMLVTITITNNGQNAQSYLVSITDEESWTDSSSIEDSTLSANSGNSISTIATLVPSEAGQRSFNIKVVYDGNVIEQPVTVSVKSKDSLFSGVFSGGASATSYLITGIVILIVLIVIVLLVRALSASSRE